MSNGYHGVCPNRIYHSMKCFGSYGGWGGKSHICGASIISTILHEYFGKLENSQSQHH